MNGLFYFRFCFTSVVFFSFFADFWATLTGIAHVCFLQRKPLPGSLYTVVKNNLAKLRFPNLKNSAQSDFPEGYFFPLGFKFARYSFSGNLAGGFYHIRVGSQEA